MGVETAVAERAKPILRVLAGERLDVPPVWIMRQAGRYLPEYRDVRAGAGSFLDLCYTPRLAAEVTLQPIRRFGFDAAIMFSDILVVPDALGQPLRFVEGEGPRLDPVDTEEAIARLDQERALSHLQPVFEAIGLIRQGLPPDTALLGFCGAPWTVATYMVAGRGTPDQAPARLLAHRRPDVFARLIDILVEASTAYLVAQFRAGVDAVQIFDTWAGSLTEDGFAKWCVAPIRRIVEGVRAEIPAAPIIAFPKGIGTRSASFVGSVPVNGIGLDWSVDRAFARDVLQPRVAVQGNVDPLALLAGGDALSREVDATLEAFTGGPHIFNLGHGILPATPVEHVEALLRRVRG